MFGLKVTEGVGNELSWWLEMAPENKAIIGINDKEINLSNVDAFYDYLVESAIESRNNSNVSRGPAIGTPTVKNHQKCE